MNAFVDRILLSLGAFLIVLANELRLFSFAPQDPAGAADVPATIRMLGETRIVYLAQGDMWLRSVLAAGAITFIAFVLIMPLSGEKSRRS